MGWHILIFRSTIRQNSHKPEDQIHSGKNERYYYGKIH